ncbi:hypothetical protein NLJ89_g623 [Agrocybe chaxingu]|uniref:HAT C-terminal dimerisation domain-containing protein n=1 Tax=Agrocybe chaxingu TaxID=84603 RepID=A0A9W8N1R1_9AGAR|nr:hypothetical protein NLJ89_g623 [Agrocybe chaxingu]
MLFAASSSRPARVTYRSKLMAAVAAEQLDEFGTPADPADPKKRRRTRKKKLKTASDEETDYTTDSDLSSDGSDSDVEMTMGNEELAEGLPSKTVPETPKRRPKKTKPKRAKTTANTVQDDNEQPQPTVKWPSKMAGKTSNPIYLFYEKVTTDADGTTSDGTKYFKCYHGTRKTVKITKGMKGSLNNLVGHLQRSFPAHHRLYEVLAKRGSPPTKEEIEIASGKKRMDDALVKKYLNELETISKNIREMFEQQLARNQEPWDQAHFEALVAKWVAACDQPFSAVEDEEFCEMLQYVHHQSHGKLKIPSQKGVRERILEMETEMVDGFQAMFKENTSNFAISLDAWTSSNGHAFMAIVIHYISNTGKLEECLIDFRELIGEHSGDNMADSVWETIELYGLKGQITAFVMDNATNNDTLVEFFAERCRQEGIDFDEKNACMRCLPHTIHLAALKLLESVGALTKEEAARANSRSSPYQDAATEDISSSQDDLAVDHEDEPEDWTEDVTPNSGVIGRAVFKLRKIVRFVQSSPQQRQKFRQEVLKSMNKGETLPGIATMLILDVRTRWSSTHQMLRHALGFKDPIDNYTAHSLHEHELNEQEWEALKHVMDWLRSFREATTQMSATKRSMLSTTHAVFRGLQDDIKNILIKLPNDLDPTLKNGLVEAHCKLSDYFTKFDKSNYYHWAALLDPRISYTMLLDDYKDDPDLHGALELAKASLESHFETFYNTPASSQSMISSGTSQDNQRSPRKNFASRYTQKRSSATAERNELWEYFRQTAEPANFEKTDPLEWWHARRESFPNLYRLARDVLCIPGSAVAVERVFSGGRDVIGIRRASLHAQTIRSLMLVKAQLCLQRKAILDIVGDL